MEYSCFHSNTYPSHTQLILTMKKNPNSRKRTLLRLILQGVHLHELFNANKQCKSPQHSSMHLELHVMRTITSLEGESLVQVLLQHGNLLDALHQRSINSLLVGLALLRNDGLPFIHFAETYHILLREEFLGLLGRSLEISITYSLRNLDRGNVDLGGGGNDVALVYTAQRNLVDLVRS